MWQSQGKPKDTAKARRDKARKNLGNMKAVIGTLKIGGGLDGAGKVLKTKIFLTDIRPGGLACFTAEAIPLGEQASLTFEYPKVFFVKGEVKSSYQCVSSGKVVSENRFDYRIQLEFRFSSANEESAVRDFCETIRKDFQGTPEAA